MPAYSPMGEYKLTSTQVDLILYCLEYITGLTPEEDNERRKIVEALQGSVTPFDYNPEEDPYERYCDI